MAKYNGQDIVVVGKLGFLLPGKKKQKNYEAEPEESFEVTIRSSAPAPKLTEEELPRCADPLCRKPFVPYEDGDGWASNKLCGKCHRRRCEANGLTEPPPRPKKLPPQAAQIQKKKKVVEKQHLQKTTPRPPAAPASAVKAPVKPKKAVPLEDQCMNPECSDEATHRNFCEACYRYQLRHGGEMRPVERLAFLRSPASNAVTLVCDDCNGPTTLKTVRPGNVPRCERCRKHFSRHGLPYPQGLGESRKKVN